MRKISIMVSSELSDKLSKLAHKSGRSLEDCVDIALREYIENYEDVYKTDLCSVDNLERSFFLSIAE